MHTVLYIHGMGGGSDSRIPSLLNDALSCMDIAVIARTYDFDPENGAAQIASWVSELHPELVIGESLGAIHALRIAGVPHLYVSPALNAPLFLHALSWLSLFPGVTWIFDRIYRPREGDRQSLHFTFSILNKYRRHMKEALTASAGDGGKVFNFAFFGTRDHYRRSGVVSVRAWRRYFGDDTYALYEGTHFMEEDFIHMMLLPKIREFFPDMPQDLP